MRWIFRETHQSEVARLSRELSSLSCLRSPHAKLTQTLATLLLQRGIGDAQAAEKFLNPSLDHLHSPYSMKGMTAAVSRIEAALDHKEGILVYGDYDVDGTAAIVILKTAIELCGGTADFHVPHRIKEGYDLRGDVIERASQAGIRLVVSVDAGIRAFAAAESASRAGVDLIVTDHHLPGPDGLPKALAILNPNQEGCEYPCKSLCGAGVAFKLAQALLERRLPDRDQRPLLMSFLKIVAIATVADSVPLVGENRVFAKLGLDGLQRAVNPGLRALIEVAQLGNKPLTSTDVGFRIAPRINAAGRMEVARDVIDLFGTKDLTVAREIATKLDRLNSDRQEEERRIIQAIHVRTEGDPALSEAYCMVIEGEGWHRGVIGITATRVVERYGRPALIISCNGDEAHGSGRSIPAFHLLDSLEACASLFTRFGGHAHAVGFSLPTARVPELRQQMDKYARERLTLVDFEPVLHIDAETSLDSVQPELFEALKRMEPFGMGNRQPIFSARGVRLMTPPRIMKERHIKLRVAGVLAEPELENELTEEAVLATPRCHPDGSVIPRRASSETRAATSRMPVATKVHNALGWNLAEKMQQSGLIAGDLMDIAFTLEYNNHADFGGLELSLKDFKSAS